MRACVPALAFAFVLPVAGSARAQKPGPLKPPSSSQQFPPHSGIPARDVQELAKKEKLTFVSPKDLAVSHYRVSDGDTVMIGRPGFGSFQAVTPDGVHHPILFPNRGHHGGGEDTRPVEISIRVMHADAPEVHVPDGHGHMLGQGEPGVYATNFVSRLLTRATKIEVAPNQKEPIDKYGRVLGEVYATVAGKGGPRTLDVNRELIKRGYGDLYEIYSPGYDVKQFSELSALSANAVQKKLGIYGKDHFLAERPYIFRAKVQDRPVVRYVADMKSMTIYGPKEAPHVPISNRLWIDPEYVSTAQKELGLKLAKGTSLPSL